MRCIINDDVVLSRPLEGPLQAHIAAFAQWASEQGYAWGSRYRRVLLAAGFSRWLGAGRPTAARLNRASETVPAISRPTGPGAQR